MIQEMIKKLFTLLVIHQDNKVLLGMKKRGFGEGRWNGFGGKVLPEESIEAAALRELREEAGITSDACQKRGVLRFSFEGKPEILETHVFSLTRFEGNPQETEEMKPQWFEHNAIPYTAMWPDDQHWLPLLLAHKNFMGEFHFKDQNSLLRYTLNEYPHDAVLA